MFSVIQEKTVLLTCLESGVLETKSGRAICERCATEGRLYSFFASSTYVTAKERLPAVLSVIYEEANDPALSIKVYTERLRQKGLRFSGSWYLKG